MNNSWYDANKRDLWRLVFYHNSSGGVFFSKGSHELLSCNTAQKFSKLGSLRDTLKIGKYFEFLLEYPEFNHYIHWLQPDNPTKTSTLTDFIPIHVPDNTIPFAGLMLSSEIGDTYIDGTSSISKWFYAIGAYHSWPSEGYFPGPQYKNSAGDDLGVSVVRLYVRINYAKTCKSKMYTYFNPFTYVTILLISIE